MLLVSDTCYLAYRVLDGNAYRDEQQAELKAAQTQLDRYKEIDIENDVHYATFINYGFPPRPRPSNKPNSLSAVYYRGNDERTDTMFNGGQYLTVTFELQLETEDGQPIEFGQSLGDQKPWLAIRFIRAADTSAGYYTREYMSRMHLSMKAERALGRDRPVEDRSERPPATGPYPHRGPR